MNLFESDGIEFDLGDFVAVSVLSVAVVVLVMGAVAIAARRTGRASVVDVAWGLGFVMIALVCAIAGPLLRDQDHWFVTVDVPDTDLAAWHHALMRDQQFRGWLIFTLVAIWGGRLAWHIARRGKGQGEDPRYVELLKRGGLFRKVLVPQGLAMWFVSIPVQVSAVTIGNLTWLVWAGVAFWVIGFLFEVIGDAQLAAYKRDPERGPVMDRGLWAMTRHPNYFGDAVMWWGIWLIAASAWPGVLTVLSPIAMTWFLRNVTGAKLLERTMMKRPGYPEYAERVPMFFPRSPWRAFRT